MPATARDRTQQRKLKVLAQLSDGEPHSGEQLARRLRVSRAAVWKLIGGLRELGVAVEAEPRRGYRLPHPVDLLNQAAIADALPHHTRERVAQLDVLFTVDSTNRYVYDAEPPAPGLAHICTAEVQTAGRGRRGRSWAAPFGSGVCMSIGWRFLDAPPTFSALGLAVGVAAVRALRVLGLHDVELKWPNDLLWRGRKLGGILIEMRAESAGPAHVVIGLGLNVHMPAQTRLLLAEQHAALVADLQEAMHEARPTRNLLIAHLSAEIISMLGVFERHGFAACIDEWRSLDALRDANVKVINGASTLHGVARGVDADGALLVEIAGEVRKFVSGEVSLRRSERAAP